MAFLTLLSSEKQFDLSQSSIIFISNANVPGFDTILIDDPSIMMKHAVIKHNGKGLYQVMDICSGTFIKTREEPIFEELDPLTFYTLGNFDVLRFGNIKAKVSLPAHESEVVESSQTPVKFFVPETEVINDDSRNSDQLSDFEIPATQAPLTRTSSLGSLTQGTELDILSVVDERSNDGSKMSQDIFGGTNFNRTSEIKLEVEEDDEFDEDAALLIKQDTAKVPIRAGTATPDFESQREGSVTPDLDLPEVKDEPKTPQAFIPTQWNPDAHSTEQTQIPTQTHRPLLQADIQTQLNPDVHNPPKKLLLQADIATQIVSNDQTDDEDTQDFKDVNPSLMEPTQPFFLRTRETRLHLKRQSEIKPKTVSLTDFDETQDLLPSKRMRSFVVETQPVLFDEVKSATPVKNKIFESDSSEEEFASAKTSAEKPSQISVIVTSIKKPPNSSLTPIPKDQPSQNRIFNSDDDSDDSESLVLSAVPSGKKPQVIKSESKSPKTPGKFTDSPILSGQETPELIPQLPSDSQVQPFLEIVNASQPSNESAFVFDVTLAEKKTEKTENNFKRFKKEDEEMKRPKKVRRRIMKYASDSDDENKPSTSAKVLRNSRSKAKTELKKSSPENPPQKTFKTPVKKSKNLIFVISNIYDEALKKKYVKICEKLGGRFVESITEADVLVTDKKLKMTAKLLASICKGIPIVSGEYFMASQSNKKWLDPSDFIIVDKEMESKKSFVLKETLKIAKRKKFLQGYSIIITEKTKIPKKDMIEIIEIAGAEVLQSVRATPSNENIALIYNEKEKSQYKLFVDKYPNSTVIKDSDFCSIIMKQEL